MRAPRELYGMPARNFAPDVILPPFRSSRHFLGPRRQGAGYLQQMCQQHLFASGRRATLSFPTHICWQVSRFFSKIVDDIQFVPR